jgi:hypothetical protein
MERKVIPFNEWNPELNEKNEEIKNVFVSPGFDEFPVNESYAVAIQDDSAKIADALKELGAKIKKIFDFGIITVELGDSTIKDIEKIPGVEYVEIEKAKK